MIWKIIVIAGIVILISFLLIMYNKLVKLKNRVKEAFSTMDVYLKKRWDLVPNLVEVVKTYTIREKEALLEVTRIRTGAYNDLNNKEKVDTNLALNTGLNNFLAVVENYPELKSNENYLDLSHKLYEIEEEIAKSRKYYNATVKVYNDRIQMFPSNIVATIFGFKEYRMFEIDDIEKENVNVKIGDK